MKEKIMELTKEKEVMKRTTTNYEFLATKNERNVQEIKSELIRTQKNWKMLNTRTEKLDDILTMG